MTDGPQRFDRRTFVQGTAALATVGVLAGCSSNGGGNGNGGGDGGTVSDEAKERVDSHLEDDETYDGSVVDMTGEDEVVVEVGVEGNGGPYAYDPSAVAISAGTTVSWQWTGNGSHNVVSTDGSDVDFDSGDPKTSGDPFEQSFDDTGVGLYVCEPHAGLGMKGAVVVVE